VWVNVGTIPDGWIWLHYLSYLTYTLRGAAQNEYFGLQFQCSEADFVPPKTLPNFSLPPPNGFNSQQVCPIGSGQVYLASYNMDTTDPNEKWTYTFYVFLFMLAFNLIAILGLTFLDYSGEEAFGKSSTTHHATENPKMEHPKRATAAFLEFDNLVYEVDVPRKDGKRGTERKRLLNNIYGYAPPGKMVALMGASGAGKTTLLDVLAGMKTGGHVTGSIKVNGKPVDFNTFKRVAGYVEQFDSHLETATVREAIAFSADLRLPSDISAEEKAKRVELVMDKLELMPYAEVMIGSPSTGGLLADIRKKVTIAVELIMDPDLLFLDEPTTGLSSKAALEVMRVTRRLAEDIPVLCTIHQPSAEIFNQFDWLLLLQSGGEVVYFGPVDEVPKYFSRQVCCKARLVSVTNCMTNWVGLAESK